MYRELGQFDRAVANFQKANQVDPKHVQSLFNMGVVLLNDLKQPKKALRFAEEGLKEARLANDRDAEGYLNDLAGAARKQGA